MFLNGDCCKRKNYYIIKKKLNKTIKNYLQTKEEFFPIIEELLYQKEIKKSVRLLGISITNLYRDNLLPKENLSVQLKFDL